MKLFSRIPIGLLLLFFGYQALKKEFEGYSFGVFDEFNYVPLGIVVFLTFINLRLDYSNFKADKKIYEYSISFFALTICFILFCKIIQRISIDRSKSILKVVNKQHAKNVWQFNFKENENFILTDRNMLGYTIFYGKYKIQGDTLKIIESNYRGDVKEFPKMGIIKGDTVLWNEFDEMLIEKK